MNLFEQELASVTDYYDLFLTDPIAYQKWLVDEIEADNARFSNFRKKPKGTFPISWRRQALYARLIRCVHGTQCIICGFSGRLELAHLAYFCNSVPARELKRSASILRMIEALKHPDRIVRLCALCHDIFDYARKHGAVGYLGKIEALIVHSQVKEAEARASGEIQEPRSLSA